ncbi:MAG: hypothetical protein COC23_00270, partial [Hyphomicrobiales bacterium]
MGWLILNCRLIASCLFLFLWGNSANSAQRNDVNIVIAMDCSWSVNSSEYKLQIAGIAAAFSDPEILLAIRNGNFGQIGVTLTQWSTRQSQIISVPWTQIASPSDGISFASKVIRARRQTLEGGTSISGALIHAKRLLENEPVRAERQIVDVISDGENNNGERIESVRDLLIIQGITINGLAIENEIHWLHYYLRNRVIGGFGSFVEKA